MRPIYLFLKITLPYAFSLFFKRKKLVRQPSRYRTQTIFVSNHPNAFADGPLIASSFRPVVFFMTRGDVFKWWTRLLTSWSHLIPIYREAQDGADAHQKNSASFSRVIKVLQQKKSLLVFGEGYTDDVFIRSVKPIKKGAARMGFTVMEASNWEADIKVQPLALNYSNPRYFRSDCLLSFGEVIHLKSYKTLYQHHPNRAITELTRRIERGIREHTTYLQDLSYSDFFEQLSILSRKGMHHLHFDRTHSLEERFAFSKQLAHRLNTELAEAPEQWQDVKRQCAAYFATLEETNFGEQQVVDFIRAGNRKATWGSWFLLFITSPVLLISLAHTAVPYLIVKKTVERLFKRKVFWSGVKLFLGGGVALLFNLPVFWLLPAMIQGQVPAVVALLIAFVYFAAVPFATFIGAYHWLRTARKTRLLMQASPAALRACSEQRNTLLATMHRLGIC